MRGARGVGYFVVEFYASPTATVTSRRGRSAKDGVEQERGGGVLFRQ